MSGIDILPPTLRGGGAPDADGGPPRRSRSRARLVLAIVAVAAVVIAVALTVTTTPARQPSLAEDTDTSAPSGLPATPSGWSTVFSDDFEGAAGSAIDSQWQYDTGPGSSFGTGEIETMTNSTGNVYTDGNGNLDITALENNGAWTSGRVRTTSANVGAPAGGELEVTASLEQPAGGLGYWPAFWMVGPGQWPSTGEIDILEDVNSLSELSGTAHCDVDPGGACNEPDGISSGLRSCPGCQSGYHTYSMVLNRTNTSDESITFYLDSNPYFSVSESQVGAGVWQAAYDHNMSIILDLAMGGAYPNGVCQCTAPNGSTTSGGTMSVAYVAAYTTDGAAASPTPAPTSASPTPAPTSAPSGTTSVTPTQSPAFQGQEAQVTSGATAPATQASTGPSGFTEPSDFTSTAPSVQTSASAANENDGTGEITGVDGLCIEDRGGGTANFTPVQVANCNGSTAQTWTVDISNDTIHALGKCFDVNGGGTTQGTSIDLYACNNEPAQVLVPEHNGEIYNPHSNMCVTDLNSNAPGTQLGLYDCTDAADQRWTVPEAGWSAGAVTGVNGLCLEARGGGAADFTPVQVAACNGSNAQDWIPVTSDDTIHALGECLDVNGGGTTDGTAIDLYACNNEPAQVFVPESSGELYNPHSGMCLDDPNSDGAGTQLEIWACNGGANQVWKLP